MRCIMQNPGEHNCQPAIAILVASPSLNRIPICKRDLDWWLDDADDEGDAHEPADLIFL